MGLFINVVVFIAVASVLCSGSSGVQCCHFTWANFGPSHFYYTFTFSHLVDAFIQSDMCDVPGHD